MRFWCKKCEATRAHREIATKRYYLKPHDGIMPVVIHARCDKCAERGTFVCNSDSVTV